MTSNRWLPFRYLEGPFPRSLQGPITPILDSEHQHQLILIFNKGLQDIKSISTNKILNHSYNITSLIESNPLLDPMGLIYTNFDWYSIMFENKK